MMNSKQVVLATLNELLKQWDKNHSEHLASLAIKDASPEEVEQIEAELTNLLRLRGLIMWIEQGEKIKPRGGR